MLARIAVAATAPFGADILERLAADHDIALLLTRPDKPRGRGRKLAPTAGEGGCRAARHPGCAAREARRELEIPADTIVVAAYGLLIPDELLDHGALAQRPPVAAAALARRRAGRARAAWPATRRPA